MARYDLTDPRWVNYIILQCLCDGQSQNHERLDSQSKFAGEIAKIQSKVWLFHSSDTWIGWVSQGLNWSFWKVNPLVCWTFKSNWTLQPSAYIKAVKTHLEPLHVSTQNRKKRLKEKTEWSASWAFPSLFLYTDWWSFFYRTSTVIYQDFNKSLTWVIIYMHI